MQGPQHNILFKQKSLKQDNWSDLSDLEYLATREENRGDNIQFVFDQYL